MASVLTDKYLAGSRVATLAPVPNASAGSFQFKTGDAEAGVASGLALVKLPTSASAKATPVAGSVPARRYRATLFASVTTATTVNVTANITLTDTANTATIIATSGAKAVNTATGVIKLIVEFDYVPGAANLSGSISGAINNSLVTAGALSNTAQPSFTGTTYDVPFISASLQLSGADAGSSATLQELTLELL